MSCEEKLRQIAFRLEDRLETVRGAYSERLERTETEKHSEHLATYLREVISIFEADEREMIAVLKIAEVAEEDGDQKRRTASIYPSVDEINALPEKFRQYVHDLETRCDKSGDVQTIAILREDRDALQRRADELESELNGGP